MSISSLLSIRLKGNMHTIFIESDNLLKNSLLQNE